jgi:hypothetical protein
MILMRDNNKIHLPIMVVGTHSNSSSRALVDSRSLEVGEDRGLSSNFKYCRIVDHVEMYLRVNKR